MQKHSNLLRNVSRLVLAAFSSATIMPAYAGKISPDVSGKMSEWAYNYTKAREAYLKEGPESFVKHFQTGFYADDAKYFMSQMKGKVSLPAVKFVGPNNIMFYDMPDAQAFLVEIESFDKNVAYVDGVPFTIPNGNLEAVHAGIMAKFSPKKTSALPFELIPSAHALGSLSTSATVFLALGGGLAAAVGGYMLYNWGKKNGKEEGKKDAKKEAKH